MPGDRPIRNQALEPGHHAEPPGLTFLRSWFRPIGVCAILGSLVGLAIGLFGPRQYLSRAVFIPSEADQNLSGLAVAATQFGIQIPATTNGWGPPVYIELLRSPALLKPIVLDSIATDRSGGWESLMDLLDVPELDEPQRVERAIEELGRVVSVSEDKRINAVKVAVTTEWPEVSLALADRLVAAVHRFNLETRTSQAAAERQFVEARADEAREALRHAEDRLQTFLGRNRSGGDSPGLRFERDRLEREVMLRQTVYTSLVQNAEEARIKEVRNTPVLTMIERPSRSALGEPRRIPMKFVLGAALGAMLAGLVAFGLDTYASVRGQTTAEESRQPV